MFHPQGPTFLELARQALSSTQRGYDLLAPKFDVTPFRTPDEVLAAIPPLLGSPGSINQALDLCCGTGAGVEMLHPLCRDSVVGIDFSQGMLEEARNQLKALTDGAAIELLQADVLDLDDTVEGNFDLVTCFGALGHFVDHDQPRLIKAARRALAPGGRFVFVTAERPPPWSPRLWLARSFNALMAVRNALWRPRFVMVYLTFLLPEARQLLAEEGFDVEIHPGFCGRFPWLSLVVASATPRPPLSPPHSSMPKCPV